MQGEFRMITDLASVTPKELRFNYEELKSFLTEALQDYKTLIVTEDAISDAKAKRAKLNKLADNINSYRINVKKQLMAQYDGDFKPKCDELVAMTKEASDNISNQIKAFEEAERDAKIAEIRAAYDELAVGELADYYPWDRFYNPKWENKGVTAEAAAQEISRGLADTVNDLNTIRQMGGDDTAYLLDVYKQTHDLSAVVRKASELKTMREREAARRREAEEKERIATAQAPRNDAIPAPEQPQGETLVTVSFKVTCTKAQLTALGQYMRANGIQYGRA